MKKQVNIYIYLLQRMKKQVSIYTYLLQRMKEQRMKEQVIKNK